MKSLAIWNLIVIGIVSVSCFGNPSFAQDAKDSVDSLNWMAGNWIREIKRNEKIVSTVEEQWMKPRGDLMLGINRSVRFNGSNAFEFMRIAKTDNGISFIASPGGKSETEFPLKTLTKGRVVFENPDHDFPQRIIYYLDGDQLVGRIEGKINGQEKSTEWKFAAAD